jgi:phage baseplate assembly protein W
MSRPPTNLLTPFRRDRKRDFASGAGRELVRSKVLQVLLTEGDTPQTAGELPWRTAFGAGLHLLRHQRNDAALAQLARVRVRDALRRWMPGFAVDVEASADENALTIEIVVASERVTVSVNRRLE